MDLDKTFSAISDYYKFLITLWGAYIGICTLALGWLMTQHGSGHMLGWKTLLIMMVAFAVVTVIFYHVLSQYQDFLKKLLKLADAQARVRVKELREAAAKASHGDTEPSTSSVAGALLELFDQQPGVRALDNSLRFVWGTAGIVIVIALALKIF